MRRPKLEQCDVGDHCPVSDAERTSKNNYILLEARLPLNDPIRETRQLESGKIISEKEFRALPNLPKRVFKLEPFYEPNGERIDVWRRVE